MSDVIIQAKNLSKYYGKLCALKNLNLSITRGKVYALLGRNGAGKSSLLKILTGFEDASGGAAELFGNNCDKLTPDVRAKTAYLVEGQYMYGNMTIDEMKKFSKPFYKNWSDKKFDDIINYFNLNPKAKIKTISRGQRAQVYFAVILSYSPELLILDDPMLGLDAAARRDILEVIVSLIHNQNCTVLYSTHILNEVERVADSVGIIDNGNLIVDCEYSELIAQFTEYRAEKNNNIEFLSKKYSFIHTVKNDFDSMKIITRNAPKNFSEILKKENISIFESKQMTLEDIFLALTAEKYSGSLYELL